MDRRTPITAGRRYTWLPALALAAVAVAGCSSSGGGSTAAPAPTSTATTAPGTGTGTTSSPAATTPATAPTPTAPTPTAPTPAAPPSATPSATSEPTAGTTPAGTGKRPADACTLLTSPQVIAVVGTAGPFTGTHFSPVDGKPVWGCTWGSRQSYADIRESSPSTLAALKSNPEFTSTPLPGVGQEAYLVQRKDGFRPEVFFVSDGHVYSVEVVKDRGPNDEVNAAAEAAAASTLALALSKLV